MVKITEEQIEIAESAIRDKEKIYNYRTTQWEIDHICRKFWDWEKDADFTVWDLFVPPYQRDYVWSTKLKCKFIESLFLNVPIPYIFVSEDSREWGMEIVDWYQRIRTMYEFINNSFKLNKLDKLPELNWFKFKDLSIVRQKLFSRKVMNVVIFQDLEIEQKKEMFARINTTSENLRASELRKGIIWWPFYSFMKDLSELPLFKKLCPLSKIKLKREENIELILRYFAYTEWFDKYVWRVDIFLTEYMEEKSKLLTDNNKDEILGKMKEGFIQTLNFVDKNFKYWFRKTWRDKSVTSRVYFESVAVWVWLALIEKQENYLDIEILTKLFKNSNYKKIITSDWANAPKKFNARILAMKNALVKSELPILDTEK